MHDTIQYIDDFVYERYEWEFAVCPWGSCQYQSAYYAHRALSDAFHNANDALTAPFVSGSIGNICEDFSSAFKRALIEDYEDMPDSLPDLSQDFTPSLAMNLLRDSAWDLWRAAPFVLNVLYPSSTLHVNLLNENCNYDSDYSDAQNNRFPNTNFWTGFDVFILEKAGHINVTDAYRFDT